jgi:hypothetical protein
LPRRQYGEKQHHRSEQTRSDRSIQHAARSA